MTERCSTLASSPAMMQLVEMIARVKHINLQCYFAEPLIMPKTEIMPKYRLYKSKNYVKV
jgi:hypothetical protein